MWQETFDDKEVKPESGRHEKENWTNFNTMNQEFELLNNEPINHWHILRCA